MWSFCAEGGEKRPLRLKSLTESLLSDMVCFLLDVHAFLFSCQSGSTFAVPFPPSRIIVQFYCILMFIDFHWSRSVFQILESSPTVTYNNMHCCAQTHLHVAAIFFDKKATLLHSSSCGSFTMPSYFHTVIAICSKFSGECGSKCRVLDGNTLQI